jgi:hypothetical protein
MLHAYTELNEIATNELGKQCRHRVRETHLVSKIFRCIYNLQQLILQIYGNDVYEREHLYWEVHFM